MTMRSDRTSANPADLATTPRERQLIAEALLAAEVEAASEAAAAIAMAEAPASADGAPVDRIARLRELYMSDNPGATEEDFERALPGIMRI